MSPNENDHSKRGTSISEPFYGQDPHERELLEGISLSTDLELESDEPTAVGERIRKLRELKGLSLGDVSQRTGLSEEMLQSIETDAIAPPLGTLTKLARALEMKMGYLLTTGETKPYAITRKNERKPVSRHAAEQQNKFGYSYLSLSPGMRDRSMEPFLVTLAPDAEEVLYQGDSIYYHSSIPHLVKCHQEKPTRILAVLFAETK
jgi:transcriptional regulator with XRE-family HTH domain